MSLYLKNILSIIYTKNALDMGVRVLFKQADTVSLFNVFITCIGGESLRKHYIIRFSQYVIIAYKNLVLSMSRY